MAKLIVPAIIENATNGETYLEPFVGGGSILWQIAPYFNKAYASDDDIDLIHLWMAVADGWIPPTELSEEEYKALRHSPSSPIKGFAKYGCSFGGKPWGGYARNAKGQNYAGGSSRSLVKQSTGLDNVLFKCCDYASWDDLEGTVVYCDPPYIGTTGYGKLFDHQRFWKVMDSWVDQGAIVFVSEMQAPNHWSPILTINRKRKVEAMSGSIQEFLFTRNGL